MRNSSAVRAGRAFVEVYADKTPAERDLRDMHKLFRNFGLAVTGIGLGAAGAFGGAVKQFIDTGDALDKMSLRTGVSVEALSQLNHAATLSGASAETFETGLKKMASTLDDAGRGVAESREALSRIGVTLDQLAGKSPDEQFKRIADGLSNVEDASTRAALAQDIFGRSGTQLLPMISQGAAGINALQQRAKELGLTLSTEDATAAAKLNDSLTDLWASVRAGAVAIGAKLAPELTHLVDGLSATIGKAIEWINQNGATIESAAHLAVTFLEVGIALSAAAIAMKVVVVLMELYARRTKLAAAAQAFLLAISGPKGWAMLAIGIGAGTAALWGMEKALGGIESQASRTVPSVKQVKTAGEEAAAATRDMAAASRSLQDEWKKDLASKIGGSRQPAEKLALELDRINRLTQKFGGAAELARVFGSGAFERMRDGAINAASGIDDALRSTQDEIDLLTGAATEAEIALRKMAEAGAPAEKIQAQRERLAERDRIRDEKQAADELQRRAEELTKGTANPVEVLQQQLREAEELLAKGLISEETFRRSVAQAGDAAKQATGETVGDSRGQTLSSATLRGSAEAERIIARAMTAGAGGSASQDPAKATAKNTDTIAKALLDQKSIQERMAESLAKLDDIEVGTT